MPTITKRGTSGADVQLGQKIRTRRQLAMMSQSDLAKKLGVSFQQVQKYEKGTNRVSMTRLQVIADALKEDITYFLRPSAGEQTTVALDMQAAMVNRDVIRLVKAFTTLPDNAVRMHFVRLIENVVSH